MAEASTKPKAVLDRKGGIPALEGAEEPCTDKSDQVRLSHHGLDTGVHVLRRYRLTLQVTGDGRIDIHIHEHKPETAELLSQLQRPLVSKQVESGHSIGKVKEGEFPLCLNIVIQVIGSRGDIQPFIALGKELKAVGHRVRFATHPTFRHFVLSSSLEFFSIGGDPTELMSFMVNNSGLLPNFRTIRSGSIQKRRHDMRQIIDGCWHSCFETGDGTHLHQIKEDLWNDSVDYRQRPFVADAIIANPPSIAHVHCAQRLGIPLHIMFTMPWSPTQYFPHPLAITHLQDCERSVANFLSYVIVEILIWEGLGDLVNKFRKVCLSLDRLDTITASSLIHRLRIPCTYFWSPTLLPKPPDWFDNIDVCGFNFLPSQTDYTPPQEITAFLEAGPIPIYVGFGSIVVDSQTELTRIVLKAIKDAGQRAIISKGWAKFGVESTEFADNVLIIGNVPHDWLFQHVSCVIHHGGAGTTAAGLALGRPTVIIPFFGDQHFWGKVVARAGAGPAPIPYRQLTAAKLTDAIMTALKPLIQGKAEHIRDKMQYESGVRDGVRSFHRHLDLRITQCAICPTRPAVWHLRHTNINLTGPLGATAQVLFGAVIDFVTGLADLPAEIVGNFLSAESTLRRPREHFDPYIQCQRHKISQHEEIRNGDEISGENFEYENESEDLEMRQEGQNQRYTTTNSSKTTSGLKESLWLHNHQLVHDKTMRSRLYEVRSETAFYISTIFKKTLRLIVWFPTDLSLSISRGFHNAPMLYHDPMVRPTPSVTHIRSGFKAAGKELKNGLYDGITGLVSQPLYGLKHNSAKGMINGLGKGIGGFFLKPLAGRSHKIIRLVNQWGRILNRLELHKVAKKCDRQQWK
ncbi:hypothetical protein N7523_001090 [Penicillium sp. IBT 18751x]|nr:hypothetical protein N7523_001090 [Penicillium sp. IBT 18751x]